MLMSGYLVNTPQCQIHNINPESRSIQRFVAHPSPLYCAGEIFFSLEGGMLYVDSKKLRRLYGDTVQCLYQEIQRKLVETNDNNFHLGVSSSIDLLSGKLPIEIQHEFLKITCRVGGVIKVEDHLYQIPPTMVETVKRQLKNVEAPKYTKRQRIQSSDRYNVLMLGIDSTSRLQAHRQLSKTIHFMENTLKAYELNGYNRVGDNTFLNLIPLIFGKTVTELGWQKGMVFDSFEFLWSIYQKMGYATLFAEDSTNGAIFNYAKKGFLKKPTTHYHRPFQLAQQNSNVFEESKSSTGKYYCAGPRRIHAQVVDYTKQFARSYHQAGVPFYAFTFITYISHDYFNDLGMADEDYRNVLRDLYDDGALNNTVVVYFGDHGFRYGKFRATEIGRYEENLPYIQIAFPEKFREKYPELINNLSINKRKLTSPFDLHRMLCDISNTECQGQTGVSLLDEVPTNRSCADAGIPADYCSCGIAYKVRTDSVQVKQAALALVERVNNLTRARHRELCEMLYLDSVSNAAIRSNHDSVKDQCSTGYCSTLVWSTIEYDDVAVQVTVKTTPNGALFQATINYNRKTGTCTVLGDISRINLYGEQSACIKDDFNIKKFCLCKK